MAKRITEELLGNIFPIRVVEVVANEVVLNQGVKLFQ